MRSGGGDFKGVGQKYFEIFRILAAVAATVSIRESNVLPGILL